MTDHRIWPVTAVGVGAVFGAATSLVNALSAGFADLESRAYTTGGWSVAEVVSVLLDSGWAWAGLAVAVGRLVTRENPPAELGRGAAPGALGRGAAAGALGRGAAAGALALLAATAAYAVADTVRSGGSISWYESESLVWWVTSVVFGGPLGAIGACVKRPGVIGLLARLTVPVGAAVQMIVLPPGRNEVIEAIGKTVVWTVAAGYVGYVMLRFLAGRRRERR